MKQLLSTNDLVEHMKSKGIRFSIINEIEAKSFFTNNNYYMKLASYRSNYSKCLSGKRQGQYINLDFAYLKELSTLDMHLRYIVLEMCLDIEHSIKVKLLDRLANIDNDDGYLFLKKYFNKEDPDLFMIKRIKSHKSGEYCKNLIQKYYPYFPIYSILELISFGDLLHLCLFYEHEYGQSIIPNNKFMNTVRDFRNAAAHSNCLLNHITERLEASKQPDSEITRFIASMNSIGKNMRTNQLKYCFSYNFVTLLYVYDSVVGINQKSHRYEELKLLLSDRFTRNKSYFTSNTQLCGVYTFICKVVDNLYNSSKIST